MGAEEQNEIEEEVKQDKELMTSFAGMRRVEGGETTPFPTLVASADPCPLVSQCNSKRASSQ